MAAMTGFDALSMTSSASCRLGGAGGLPNSEISAPAMNVRPSQMMTIALAAPLASAWQLMANTGLRRNEARMLAWSNVRADSLMVVSEESARTKSRKWREIPLSENAKLALAELENETDYVLPVSTGNAITQRFERDSIRAAIGGSVHSLRHTFGTHQALKGTPIRTLQKLMGHASITTTEKYLHVAETHLQEAMRGFNL